ncbi:sulfotransferase family 2 domain-containing protein [Lutibaculum baratangense]|uniref:sulfotransferase family 2 domain-containing protein n=1 Tax=Lutibaculum baratangense TaxID=1358440 RepID=UPI003CC710F4
MATRLTYGSFVCSDRGYLFVETPKAACSTLKWILAELSGHKVTPRRAGAETSRKMCIHLRRIHPVPSLAQMSDSDIVAFLTSPEVVRFTVVRNPYSRVVSAFNDKIRNGEPNYRKFWSIIGTHVGHSEKDYSPSFPDFVDWLHRKQSPDRCNLHWQAVSSLNYHKLIGYTHVINVEELAEGLRPVFHRIAEGRDVGDLLQSNRVNESLPSDWRRYYNPDIAQKIFTFYKDDFHMFRYDADSWSAPAKGAVAASEIERSAVSAIRDRNEVIADLLDELQAARRASRSRGGG